MPVIQVKALPQKPGTDVTEAMRGISSGLAESLGVSPSQVWVTWEMIPPWQYVEGNRAAAIQPGNTHPPLVSVRMFEGRSADEIERILILVADLVAEHLGIERGNVLVGCEELVSGRVYSGGAVVKRSS